ncbi:MAG: ammonia-forming cytochrome c nitrite reductase subunit c552 [Acidobacteriota bacterium]|nr:ammonia-forming cytochrome c nitrite reductase subunit c552 [Acidobacteriota bacterium]MDD8038867.1 ammonia-forming cytochrome c nitrite reductase subunit c552 [Acidobacteriota bacterium]MDW3227412.1 ammonia-forming cytochrome c nitrite reductase subunit c552 [Acidobacteriota bacterium]HOY98704.1 ammonia-forming cytochrome c nitrite reductase subunit c552 [Candidatus Aminicenantes bacterium]
METKRPRKNALLYGAAFLATAAVIAGVLALLFNVRTRREEAYRYPLKVVEIKDGEIDPAVWGKNFPLEYDTFVRTRENYGRTFHGGSERFSRIDEIPAAKRLWAGYAFSVEYNEERGHFFALTDQKMTRRVREFDQPGACANCHSGKAPALIREMGWEAFNKTPYKELSPKLRHGSVCADCHDPKTMELVITRPAFKKAMAAAGVDLAKATRQDMRTYVCAQCHVEYYFYGENKELTFPWAKGRTIEAIEACYDENGHVDWVNAETGAAMLKVQHPEFETWGTGLHAKSGVACADCHMPYVRAGSVKVSDHWIRSPLTNIAAACQACHPRPEEELKSRVKDIQDKTAGLLRKTETALLAAMDAIIKAKAAGVPDERLSASRALIRRGQLRWDFVFSENGTGFHSPQEAARVLAEAIDFARQAELAAALLAPAGIR